MSKPHRVHRKRKRRKAYLKRKKAALNAKLNAQLDKPKK